eukprot:761864-Amphidinium_carterae.1
MSVKSIKGFPTMLSGQNTLRPLIEFGGVVLYRIEQDRVKPNPVRERKPSVESPSPGKGGVRLAVPCGSLHRLEPHRRTIT